MTAVTHRVAEARSLALHRAVAGQLTERPELLDHARERVRDWLATGRVAQAWAEAWRDILAGDVDRIIAVLVDPSERACDLRQVSPFAGALDPRERWQILRQTDGGRIPS